MCSPPSRIFINRILELFRKNYDNRKIHLTVEFFQDIDWFKSFLPTFNGVTFFLKQKVISGTHHLDASLTGLGGIWTNRVYSTPVHPIPNFDLTIVHLEMFNILIALRLWGKFWQHSILNILCDNMAVVQVVATGKTKDRF